MPTYQASLQKYKILQLLHIGWYLIGNVMVDDGEEWWPVLLLHRHASCTKQNGGKCQRSYLSWNKWQLKHHWQSETRKKKNSDAPFFSASSLLLISYSHKTEAMRTPPIKQPTKSSKVEMEGKKNPPPLAASDLIPTTRAPSPCS